MLLFGCGDRVEVRDRGTRAVVIGIDGADWAIIDALTAGGDLPHLRSLRERGVWGPIATLPDLAISPVIWTSVATGKPPSEHGISWFLVDRPDGVRVPVRSTNRKTKALWNILAEHHRRPVVVGWWATFPAEDVGDGIVVSDGLGFHGFGSTARDGADGEKTYPASLFSRMAALMPAEQQVSVEFARRFLRLSPDEYRREMHLPAGERGRDASNPIHLFQEYAVTAQGYTAISEELLAASPYDLFMVYFEQVDSISHLFMKYAPPKLPWVGEAAHARYRDAVSEWYRYQDELLGRLLARIDLETTAVLVLSDHGFKSGERRIRSEATVDIRKAHLDHETHGILLAAGPHVRRGSQVDGASVMDIAPTLLHYLGFPVGRDMPGRVLEEVFEPAFMAGNPIRYLPTYEDGKPAPVTEERQEAPRRAEAEKEEQESLRALEALGYLGSPPEAAPAGTAASSAEELSSPEMRNNLGRAHLRRGEIELARQEFARALALDPENADALLNLGALQRLAGRPDEARYLVEKALQVDPNSTGALAELAAVRRDLGDLEEAIRLYREALRLDDSQPGLFLGLGDVLQRAGRLDEAESAFRSTLELDPDSFAAIYNLGVTAAGQGDLEEAVAHYERALALGPQHPDAASALNNLGAIARQQGRLDEAAERFAQAAAASPAHLESRYNLALIHAEGGRFEEAIPLLEQAIALQPNHEAVNASLGMAYMLSGRNEEAYKSLLLVRRLYPKNWIAPLGLAVLHAGARQPEEARRLLAEALRLGGSAARSEAGAYPVLEPLLKPQS